MSRRVAASSRSASAWPRAAAMTNRASAAVRRHCSPSAAPRSESRYLYRGQRIPGLRGSYLYADYGMGNFGSLRVESSARVEQLDITSDINPDGLISFSSFGTDNAGEVYVLSHSGGAFPQFVGGAGVLYRVDRE